MESCNLKSVAEERYPRSYALMEIKGEKRLVCHVSGEWIMDATCKSINQMLEDGLVCESSVSGWLSNQFLMNH